MPTFETPYGVRVQVQASMPLARMEARVNAGPWVEMSPVAEDAWHAPLDIPLYGEVEFRATSESGDQVISEPFPGGGPHLPALGPQRFTRPPMRLGPLEVPRWPR